jgi:hypothetical protein
MMSDRGVQVMDMSFTAAANLAAVLTTVNAFGGNSYTQGERLSEWRLSRCVRCGWPVCARAPLLAPVLDAAPPGRCRQPAGLR